MVRSTKGDPELNAIKYQVIFYLSLCANFSTTNNVHRQTQCFSSRMPRNKSIEPSLNGAEMSKIVGVCRKTTHLLCSCNNSGILKYYCKFRLRNCCLSSARTVSVQTEGFRLSTRYEEPLGLCLCEDSI